MRKLKFKRFIAMTMATIMVVSTNAFATPITLTDSTADASKTDTLDKSNGTDYFADETTNVWQNGSISEEVRVTVDRASRFEITIPKEIVLNGNDGSASYNVSVTGEIAGDQVISVVPDASFTLNEDGGKQTPVTVTQNDTDFTYVQLDANTPYSGSLSAPEISAGNWNGSFYFNIEFKDVSHVHNYASTVTKEATCTETGIKTYTCECGDTYTETISVNPSNHNYQGVITKQASCSEEGVLSYICTRCGDIEKTESISKTAHTYNEGVITKQATCTETGIMTYTCLCGDVHLETIAINPDNHTYDEGVVTKEATCTEKGVKTYTCTRCNKTRTEDIAINSDNHNYDEGVVTKEATCTEKGVRTYACSRCNGTKTEDIVINPDNHAYDSGVVTKEATCTETGVRTYTCTRCNGTRTEEIAIDSDNHNYQAFITKQATCSEEGVLTYSCTRCSNIQKTEPISKLPHTYDEGVITKQPTCTETGLMTYTCLCGDIHLETIAINPDNHNYDEGVVTKEPTYTETGVKTYTCSRCGNTYTENIPVKVKTFNDYTWAEIAAISEAGNAASTFSVGDEKELQIGSETYHVQILGFDHDDLSDGSGKAGITVGLKEMMTTDHVMNSSHTNAGGWKDSEMRTYVNNDVYNSLPSDLQAVIKEVNKASDIGNMNKTTLNTTQDKLFLLSTTEVGGNSFTKKDADDQGTQYEYFTDNNLRAKKYLNGSGDVWWLRSAYANNSDYFCYVTYGGNSSNGSAINSYGVVFGFCI